MHQNYQLCIANNGQPQNSHFAKIKSKLLEMTISSSFKFIRPSMASSSSETFCKILYYIKEIKKIEKKHKRQVSQFQSYSKKNLGSNE